MLDFLHPMPKPVAQMLLMMVEIAEADEVLTIRCHPRSDPKKAGFHYYDLEGGKTNKQTQGVAGQPRLGLYYLGYIEFGNDETTIFLTEKAYQWAKYQRRSTLGKWFKRVGPKVSAYTLSIGALLVSVISALFSGLLNVAKLTEIIANLAN